MAKGLQNCFKTMCHSCFCFFAVQLGEVLRCPNVHCGGCRALVLCYQVPVPVAGNIPGTSFSLFVLSCLLIMGESNSS